MNAPTCIAPIPFASARRILVRRAGAGRRGAHRGASRSAAPIAASSSATWRNSALGSASAFRKRGVCSGHFADLPAGDETGRATVARIPRRSRWQRQLHDQCRRRRRREPVAGIPRGRDSRRPGARERARVKAACRTFRSSRPRARCFSVHPQPASRRSPAHTARDPPARGGRGRRAFDRRLHLHPHADLTAVCLPEFALTEMRVS